MSVACQGIYLRLLHRKGSGEDYRRSRIVRLWLDRHRISSYWDKFINDGGDLSRGPTIFRYLYISYLDLSFLVAEARTINGDLCTYGTFDNGQPAPNRAPLRGTVGSVGVSPSLELIARVADKAPTDVGVKVMLTVQDVLPP